MSAAYVQAMELQTLFHKEVQWSPEEATGSGNIAPHISVIIILERATAEKMKLPTLVQDPSPYHDNRTLSPKEEHVFESRLSTIWKGVMGLDRTLEWDGVLSRLRSDVGVSRISSHIPTGIKRLLISPRPPTPAELQSLAWTSTTDAGVFLFWIEDKRATNEEKYVWVYVGSASSCYGGLLSRKRYFMSQWAGPHDETLKRIFGNLGPNPKGHFGTLAIVPFANQFGGDILDVRAVAILTRLVLMIWLGAVDGDLRSKTRNLCPWKLGSIQYIGVAFDNPLEIDINKSDETQQRKRYERRVKRKEPH